MEDSFTKLLIHADGINNSTYFSDSKNGKIVTSNGQVKVDTSQAKFGASSGYFDGDSDYLSLATDADWNFGTGAFTVDFWFRNVTISLTPCIFSHGGTNIMQGTGGAINITSGNKLTWYDQGGLEITGTTTLVVDNWYHVALVGNGGADGARNIKMYLNGNQEGSTYTFNYNFAQRGIYWGANQSYTPECMNGWIDEMRISKGIQRWTAPFTPPTTPYITSSGSFIPFL